jgi:hypothetical protein
MGILGHLHLIRYQHLALPLRSVPCLQYAAQIRPGVPFRSQEYRSINGPSQSGFLDPTSLQFFLRHDIGLYQIIYGRTDIQGCGISYDANDGHSGR